MRWSCTIVSLLALLWGFVQAPFDHVHAHIHADDLDHIHGSGISGSGISHVHLRSESSDARTSLKAHTADDSAVDVAWSICASSANFFHMDLEAVGQFLPAVELVPSATILSCRLHSHDPPVLASLIPRAPPA